MGHRHIIGKQGLLDGIAAAWHALRHRLHRNATFSAPNDNEVKRMALEFGLTVRELNDMIAEGPDAARQLYLRLADEKISVDSVGLEALRDMQRCCGHCDQKALCDHELEDKPKSASWPKYCPNELTIAALKTSCH